MICPVHDSSPVFNYPKEDTWELRGTEDFCCSYCGSWAPGPFLEWCKTTETGYLDVSDKRYKIYIHRPNVENATNGAIKFYTYHLNQETEAEDLKLINETVVRLKKNNPFYQQFVKEELKVVTENKNSTLEEKSFEEVDINDEGFFLINIRNLTNKARKELKDKNQNRIDLAVKDIKLRINEASKKGLCHIDYLLTGDVECELEVFADFIIERLWFMYRDEIKYLINTIQINW